MTVMLMAYYTWENKRRDSRMAGVEHKENSEFFDLTDRENPEFRVGLSVPSQYVSGELTSCSTSCNRDASRGVMRYAK